jgi:uncharacterized membrane protein YvlD (DUF360 family)
MHEDTDTKTMVDSTRTLEGNRIGLLAGHFISFAIASIAATVAVTSGPHGAWQSIGKVGLSIALADTVLERILDWVGVPPKWASTTIFLVLANAAFFGIADRLGVKDPSLKFGIAGFAEALAGAVLIVALNIVIRRVAGRLTKRQSGERTQG